MIVEKRRPSWKRLVVLWLVASLAVIGSGAGFASAVGGSAGDGAVVALFTTPLILAWAIFFAKRSTRRPNL
jgi:hypothetical protein